MLQSSAQVREASWGRSIVIAQCLSGFPHSQGLIYLWNKSPSTWWDIATVVLLYNQIKIISYIECCHIPLLLPHIHVHSPTEGEGIIHARTELFSFFLNNAQAGFSKHRSDG